ncbi:MAG: efflux RND transporter periplasmic adaptor subunit [Vicinamibacteria bacterium]
MTIRTWTVVGLATVGLAAAIALQAAGPRSAEPAARGDAAAASRAALARPVAAEGRVVAYPGGEVVVGAERAGRLVRVLAEEGQTVAKGELLAELESEELRASLEEARTHVTELEAEVRLAELNLKRRQDLADQQIVAAHDLDQARRDVETSQARTETARAAVARYEAQLRKTRILAPIAGTVVARHAQGGETIDSGARVVTLADLKHLRIEGEADEADAGSLSVGAPVTITSNGFPGKSWRGRVEEIPDSVTLRHLKPQDPGRPTDTRILAVKVAFLEPTPLRLGTTVELRIEGGR